MKPPHPDNGFCERLAEVADNREHPNGVRKWLAHQLGVTASVVALWIQGKRTPSEAMQARIAELLGLHPVATWRPAAPTGTSCDRQTIIFSAYVQGGA